MLAYHQTTFCARLFVSPTLWLAVIRGVVYSIRKFTRLKTNQQPPNPTERPHVIPALHNIHKETISFFHNNPLQDRRKTASKMVKKNTIPNAWDDDDWEAQADKAEASTSPTEPTKISKAERLAKHAEQNKKLWETAYILLVTFLNIYTKTHLPNHPMNQNTNPYITANPPHQSTT